MFDLQGWVFLSLLPLSAARLTLYRPSESRTQARGTTAWDLPRTRGKASLQGLVDGHIWRHMGIERQLGLRCQIGLSHVTRVPKWTTALTRGGFALLIFHTRFNHVGQIVHHLSLWASVRFADSEAQKCHEAGMMLEGCKGSAQGGCKNESVAHDCLVLGVCALVFELILIFRGALRSLDSPLNQIIEFFPFDSMLRPSA